MFGIKISKDGGPEDESRDNFEFVEKASIFFKTFGV